MASVMSVGPLQASHPHGAVIPAATTTSSAFVVPAGAVFLELSDSEDENDDGINTPEPISAPTHVMPAQMVRPNLIVPLSNGQAVNAHQAEASAGPAGPSTIAALVDYSESEDEDMDDSVAVMPDGSDEDMEDGSNADTSQSINADNVQTNVAGPSTTIIMPRGRGCVIPIELKLEWMRLRTEENLSYEQIAKRYGSSGNVVRDNLMKLAIRHSPNDGRRTPRPVSPKDARAWVKMRKSGLSYVQIGKRFDRTVQTVRGVVLRTQERKTTNAAVKTTGKRKRASTSEAPRQVKASVETPQAAVETTRERASAVEKQPTTSSLATTSRATTSLASTLTKEQMKTIIEILREPFTDLETLCEAVEVDEATVKAAIKNQIYARITLELEVISHTPANNGQLNSFVNSLGSSLAHLEDLVWIGQFDFALNSSFRMSLRETGPLVPNADAKLFSNQWELFAAVTKDTSIAVKDRLRSSGARKDWQVILDEVAAHLNSIMGERADLHPTVILEESIDSRYPYVRGSLIAAGWPVVVLPRDYLSLSPVQKYASSIHPIVQCTEQRTKMGTSPLSLRRHVEEEMANVPKATREEWFGQLARALSKVSSSPLSAASTSPAAPKAGVPMTATSPANIGRVSQAAPKAAAATTIASSSTTQPVRGPALPTITALKRLVKQEPDQESIIVPPPPRGEIKYTPLVNQLDSALGFSDTGTTQRLQDSSNIAANKPSEEDKKKVGVTPWRVAAKRNAS